MDEVSHRFTHQRHELHALRQRVATLEAAEVAAHEATEVLQHTVEALQVAEEELRAQNDELREAQCTVAHERARYAALFTLAPDGYVVTDAAGMVQEVNQVAAALLRRPAAALRGKPLVAYVAQTHRAAFRTLLTDLTHQERVPAWEGDLQPLEGAPVPVSLTVAVVQSSPEHAVCLYWLVRDLTAAKQAEAERQRLEREARRVQHFALLGRLAAGVSHDIRNPLGAIFLHVDLLEEELRQPSPHSAEALPSVLTEIRTQLARLEDLVEDYLSLARVATIERTPHDLGTLVRTVTEAFAGALAAQGIGLQFDGCDQLGTVAVHPNTFRRALLNLLQNAMEAMPQGGTLTLAGRRQAATVQLDVRDTGLGIAPEQYTQIFEPLHTTKPGGTGLGLYIVQEVMTAHRGTVAVHSVVGQGTTFTLTLPLTPADTPQG